MIQNTLTNIYILKADGTVAGTKIGELLREFKTYPILGKVLSLSSSEDYDHPIRNVEVEHKIYDRYSIQLSTDFPCPEFYELAEFIRKKKLQWAIICVTVFHQGSILWRGAFDYFCNNLLSGLWRNYTVPFPPSLESGDNEQGINGRNQSVIIEEVPDENKTNYTEQSYPISAYQVSPNTSQPFNGAVQPFYSGSQYQNQNPYLNEVTVVQTYRPRGGN